MTINPPITPTTIHKLNPDSGRGSISSKFAVFIIDVSITVYSSSEMNVVMFLLTVVLKVCNTSIYFLLFKFGYMSPMDIKYVSST